jgi:hypothetical protein
MTNEDDRDATTPGADWRFETRNGDEKRTRANEGLFDELVVDHWLHIEWMDGGNWWARIGDARLNIAIAQDGSVRLDVERGVYGPAHGSTSTVDGAE